MTLFPEAFKSRSSGSYDVVLTDTVKVAGYPVLSRGVCLEATQSPQEDTQRTALSLFGSFMFRQDFFVQAEAPPKAAKHEFGSVAVSKPLAVPLTKSDHLSLYKLVAAGKSANCSSSGLTLQCDIERLALTQGTGYDLKVERYFNEEKVATLVEQRITTLAPTSVIDSSIKAGERVVSKPSDIIIKTDKKLATAQAKLERVQGSEVSKVEANLTVVPEGIQVTVAAPFERSSDYRLTLYDVEAEDGSTLLSDYVLPFSMSGGPKVTGVNIGGSGVPSNATVVITFDQVLSDKQDITPFVKFAGGQAAISKAGNQVFVKLQQLPVCGDFSVAFTKDVQSTYEIAGNSAWSIASRTVCHTVSTIGYSVKGRAINAYSFGSGATKILFMGAIHGSEKSSRIIMDRWVTELEQQARTIPADRQVIVIPVVNPDGFATGQRFNVNNINLNRNFPTANWTSDTPVAGGGVERSAGGTSALSEPESRAIAQFTNRLQPRLAVTYHSQGSIVNSNDVSISIPLGQQYARATGYQYISNANTNATFDLEMTGTYEDWLLEKGIPAVLIELRTHSGDYFNAHKAAMWAMVRG